MIKNIILFREIGFIQFLFCYNMVFSATLHWDSCWYKEINFKLKCKQTHIEVRFWTMQSNKNLMLKSKIDEKNTLLLDIHIFRHLARGQFKSQPT